MKGLTTAAVMFAAVLLGGCANLATDAPAEPIPVDITPYPYNTDASGEDLPVEIGRFNVPADRQRPEGTEFTVGFVRYPATEGADGPPIVFLTDDDSPTQARQALYADLRRSGDVVVLHRRGHGFSSPPAPCHERISYAFDRALTVARLARLGRHHAAACWAALGATGIERMHFSNAQVASDVADLPRALGAETVLLIAENEETLPASLAIQRHPQRILRAVLVNSTPGTMTGEMFGEQLARLCKAAGRDGCRNNFEALLEQLATPRTLDVSLDTGRQLPVTLDLAGTGLVAGQAWRSGTAAMLKFAEILASAVAGNDEPLARAILAARRDIGQPELLAMDVETGGTPTPAVGNVSAFEFGLSWPAGVSGKHWPGLPDKVSVPVLRIDGSLVNEPSFDKAGRKSDVWVVNGGRYPLDGSDEVTELLLQFLGGEPVAPASVELPPAL